LEAAATVTAAVTTVTALPNPPLAPPPTASVQQQVSELLDLTSAAAEVTNLAPATQTAEDVGEPTEADVDLDDRIAKLLETA
jgi:hypothetical protein